MALRQSTEPDGAATMKVPLPSQSLSACTVSAAVVEVALRPAYRVTFARAWSVSGAAQTTVALPKTRELVGVREAVKVVGARGTKVTPPTSMSSAPEPPNCAAREQQAGSGQQAPAEAAKIAKQEGKLTLTVAELGALISASSVALSRQSLPTLLPLPTVIVAPA